MNDSFKDQKSKIKDQNYFVVGTDTGVGKTVVSALLALHFQARGVDVGIMKPFESGLEMVYGKPENTDARWLKNVVKVEDDLEEINPARWAESLAPLVAARRAGDSSDYWTRAKNALGVLQARHEVLVCEGVGGLLAPITMRNERILTNADWAEELSLPIILVARRTLGTINHTLLAVEVLRAREIEIAGIVFCDACPVDENDVAAQTSSPLIEEISGEKILGFVPFLENLSRADLQIAARNFSLNF